ncbi:MAG TPA: protein TolR [Nitrospiraceae bacterium]|nr:protein TolR [Nitrospiraceae bacterium]
MNADRRSSHIIREVNIIPLLDLVLTVLFFYMVVSPMMSRGLDVNLPTSVANTVKQEDRVVLTVTRAQEVFIEKERINIKKLEGVLENLKKQKPRINVYLRADRNTPYGAVVQVMDIVKRAGIDRLGMVTEPSSREKTGK